MGGVLTIWVGAVCDVLLLGFSGRHAKLLRKSGVEVRSWPLWVAWGLMVHSVAASLGAYRTTALPERARVVANGFLFGTSVGAFVLAPVFGATQLFFNIRAGSVLKERQVLLYPYIPERRSAGMALAVRF